jgi:cytochrome c biogenesis protein CcmG, thiol:disulfide interchange protein DsbE
MKWQQVLFIALATTPLVIVLALGFGRDPHRVPFALRDKPAPMFTLTDLEGKPVALQNLLGKPVVINFWATWCEPCQSEHALLQEAAKVYAGKVQFVGIVYQDDKPNVKAYLSEQPSNFPQLFDNNSHTAIEYGVAGVPESFFLDAQGVIRAKVAGVLNGETLKLLLQPLVTP